MPNRNLPYADDSLWDDGFDEIGFPVSSTEYTGLTPTPPPSDEEAASYAELYHAPQPVRPKKRPQKR